MIDESKARLTALTVAASVAGELIGRYCGAAVPAAGGAAADSHADRSCDEPTTAASAAWQRLLLGRLTELVLSDDGPLTGADLRALLTLGQNAKPETPAPPSNQTELPPNFNDIVRQIYGVNLQTDVHPTDQESDDRSYDDDDWPEDGSDRPAAPPDFVAADSYDGRRDRDADRRASTEDEPGRCERFVFGNRPGLCRDPDP